MLGFMDVRGKEPWKNRRLLQCSFQGITTYHGHCSSCVMRALVCPPKRVDSTYALVLACGSSGFGRLVSAMRSNRSSFNSSPCWNHMPLLVWDCMPHGFLSIYAHLRKPACIRMPPHNRWLKCLGRYAGIKLPFLTMLVKNLNKCPASNGKCMLAHQGACMDSSHLQAFGFCCTLKARVGGQWLEAGL